VERVTAEWITTWNKIFDSYDILKKMLSEKAICCKDCIEIFDPPYTIRIQKKDKTVYFQLDGRVVALLNKQGLQVISDDIGEFVDEWCTALTSLGFKRYSVKRRNRE